MAHTPKLYTALASWWHVLSNPADCADEAEFVRQMLMEACAFPPKTLVEFGSGDGNSASHLKKHFTLTLVDRVPGMLRVSRALNPECEHQPGDLCSSSARFDLAYIRNKRAVHRPSENL